MVYKKVGYNAAHMKEFVRPIESDHEPRLSELVWELDAADLALLKRYSWYIRIPTERNLIKVFGETSHLYHSFGDFIRKIVNGDIESDDEKATYTATVITDLAQKHHWTLSEYETAFVQLDLPDWDSMHIELEDSLSEALEESKEAFSNLAIDRVNSMIEAEEQIISLLAQCVREQRIEIGKQALGTVKDVAKVGAGTILGMAAWSKLTKKT